MITVEHLDGMNFAVSDGSHLVVLRVSGGLGPEGGFVHPGACGGVLTFWPTLFEGSDLAWRLTPLARSLFNGAKGDRL